MHLQTALPKLIRHYELKKARYFSSLTRLVADVSVLSEKIEQLIANEQALFLILTNKKLSGYITLVKLREFQRNEAVVKRKIANLRVQISSTILQKEKVENEIKEVKKHLKLCNFKFEKYMLLNKRADLDLLHTRNFIEESIIEELVYGQNK